MLMYSSRKMACPSTQMTNPLILIQQCITDMVTHHQVEIKQVDQTHLTLIIIVLTKFYPAKTIVKQKNLLKKGSEEEEEEEVEVEVEVEKHEQEKKEETAVIENEKQDKQADQVNSQSG